MTDQLNTTETSAMGWNTDRGRFYVSGDPKSIDEVRRLIDLEDRLRWFERHHRECADAK